MRFSSWRDDLANRSPRQRPSIAPLQIPGMRLTTYLRGLRLTRQQTSSYNYEKKVSTD